MGWYDYGFPRYVTVAERKRQAARRAAKEARSGRALDPVSLSGRAIAATFWGKAWCDHIEFYHDFANRLPRGRTYVRGGAVIDLKVKPGEITALVSGSEIYDVTVGIPELPAARWKTIVDACSGAIGSVVELLAGRIAGPVMQRLCHRTDGLFPGPRQLAMRCSCPDFATMCKHVAAVLYGVGARLDRQPELLFTLRGVSHADLIARAATTASRIRSARPTTAKALDGEDLGALFGIELEAPARKAAPVRKAPRPRARQRIDTRELLDRGIPRSTFQNWLQEGVLQPTGERGVYFKTARTEDRIRMALARRRKRN